MVAGPNEKELKLVKDSGGTEPWAMDVTKFTAAAVSLETIAASLKNIAADVGWTGTSADSASETLTTLGSTLYVHVDNMTRLSTVASAADAAVSTARVGLDIVEGTVLAPDAPLIDGDAQATADATAATRESRATATLATLDAAMATMTIDAQSVLEEIETNPVEPARASGPGPSGPVPVRGPGPSTGGPTHPGVAIGVPGVHLGPGGPGGPGGKHGPGVVVGPPVNVLPVLPVEVIGPKPGLPVDPTTGVPLPTGTPGETSVDGGVGGTVAPGDGLGTGGYGSVSGGFGQAGSGALGGSGTEGLGGAGSGSRHGTFGGTGFGPGGPSSASGMGAGALGAGGAGASVVGGRLAGAPGARGVTGPGGMGSDSAAGGTGKGGATGTSSTMAGGVGAGGRGGSSSTKKRRSGDFFAPTLDEHGNPVEPELGAAARSGSRQDASSVLPEVSSANDEDDDSW